MERSRVKDKEYGYGWLAMASTGEVRPKEVRLYVLDSLLPSREIAILSNHRRELLAKGFSEWVYQAQRRRTAD